MHSRACFLALVAASALLGALTQSASAQYYDRRYYEERPPPPPPGYYEERRYYREGPPPGYGQPPPGYYGQPGYGPPPGYREGPPQGYRQSGPPPQQQGRRGFVACAKEHGYCAFQGPATVSYGANGRFVKRQAVNGIACNNQTFGDPAPGLEKACFLD